MSSPVPLHHDISYSKAVLVGAWIEGALYGLNFALYCFTVYLYRNELKLANGRVLLGISTVQIIVATAHWASTLPYLFAGFLTHVSDPGGSDAYFNQPSSALSAIQYILFLINYVIGDGVMAWRCYVVWGKKIWVAIPLGLMTIAAAICGFSTIGHIETLSNVEEIFAVQRWATSLFSLSLSIQVICTTLITWKLWWRSPRSVPTTHNSYISIVRMIIEAGTLLTVITTMDMTLYLLHMNAGAIFNPVISQVSCIVPLSILVRGGMRRQRMNASNLPHHNDRNNIVLVNTTKYTTYTNSISGKTSGTMGVEDITPGDALSSYTINP